MVLHGYELGKKIRLLLIEFSDFLNSRDHHLIHKGLGLTGLVR